MQIVIMSAPADPNPEAATPGAAGASLLDGFEVLDACHRQTLAMLRRLAALVAHLQSGGPAAQVQAVAAQIVAYFSTTARQHHEDEERHVFPKLIAEGSPQLVQAVLRLQQDHGWLEEDWMELSAHLDALAQGQAWADVAQLSEGVHVFAELSRAHIALEEASIYPAARARLKAPQLQEMAREMAQRRHAQRKAGRGRVTPG
jgi:hemerythrin-like domain-containing protein